jgi:hypothetical protein
LLIYDREGRGVSLALGLGGYKGIMDNGILGGRGYLDMGIRGIRVGFEDIGVDYTIRNSLWS